MQSCGPQAIDQRSRCELNAPFVRIDWLAVREKTRETRYIDFEVILSSHSNRLIRIGVCCIVAENIDITISGQVYKVNRGAESGSIFATINTRYPNR